MRIEQLLPESGHGFPDYSSILLDDPGLGESLADRIRRLWKRGQIHFPIRAKNYLRFRALLPMPALALVWCCAMCMGQHIKIDKLVNYSVSIRHMILGAGVLLIWELCLASGLSSSHRIKRDVGTEAIALIWTSVSCGTFLLMANLAHLGYTTSLELGAYLALVLLVEGLLLLVVSVAVASTVNRSPKRIRKSIIIGSGNRSQALRRLVQMSQSGLQIIGCLDDLYVGTDRIADNYLGDLSELSDVLKQNPIEVVFIGLPIKSYYDEIQRMISTCESIGVECHYMKDIFSTSRIDLQMASAPSRIAVLADAPRDVRHLIKRIIDIVLATVLLLVLSPILCIVSLLIKFTSRGPILFVQQRYGLHRRRFAMLKFRTMVADAETKQRDLEILNEAQGPVFKMKSDPRITRVGGFLRRTSLDEVPQLINVLRGDMSLVGPRPLPIRDVSRFDQSWLLRRFSVVPGLTCLWQIGGRSNTSFEEWIKLDLRYIDQWSLALDFQILARTIPAVFRGDGAM